MSKYRKQASGEAALTDPGEPPVGVTKAKLPERWCQGPAYKPHFKVQDIPSLGRSSRIAYQERTVHLVSDLEVRAFRHFQWDTSVIGIEEQYALDIDDTQRIANDMGISHPTEFGTTTPFVMSTDLVIYFNTPTGSRRTARAIKYAADVELGTAPDEATRKGIAKTIGKLEIERRYWAERNVSWALLTENELNSHRSTTIEMLLSAELDATRADGFWHDAAQRVCDAMIRGDGSRVSELQRELGQAGILSQKDFSSIFRHLCATRQLEFDMDRKFSLIRPVSDFQFTIR